MIFSDKIFYCSDCTLIYKLFIFLFSCLVIFLSEISDNVVFL